MAEGNDLATKQVGYLLLAGLGGLITGVLIGHLVVAPAVAKAKSKKAATKPAVPKKGG